MTSTAPSSAPTVETLSSEAAHAAFIASSIANPNTLHTIQFTASWHEPSVALQSVLSALQSAHPTLRFALIDAEALQDVTETYTMVDSVPFFLFIKGGKVIDSLQGADSAVLTQKVEKLSRPPILVAHPVPVPIPSASSSSSSPSTVPVTSSASDLNRRLKSLINQAPIMLFIKGSPSQPRCGFSQRLLGLMQERRIPFQWFDILTDNEVREGLKQLSNWPSYPQVYENGQLVGGLDVVKELMEAGEFPSSSSSSSSSVPSPPPLRQRLEKLLRSSPVLLFMKGDRDAPRCGFSRSAVEILNGVPGLQFETFDILQDEEVRKGLKEYSNWPTYPQLYVEGELIGGLDVMKELKESGELEEQLRAAGTDKAKAPAAAQSA